MATFVITKNAHGKYKLAYHDYKGTAIAVGQAIASKNQCLLLMEAYKNNFFRAEIDSATTSKEQYYFEITLDEEVIFKSRKFNTLLRKEKALDDFKKNFVTSEVLDFTENIFEPHT